VATESAVIAWTPSNWITIVLMAAITFFVIGTGARIWQQRQANRTAATGS
jgi:hypothetical protein